MISGLKSELVSRPSVQVREEQVVSGRSDLERLFGVLPENFNQASDGLFVRFTQDSNPMVYAIALEHSTKGIIPTSLAQLATSLRASYHIELRQDEFSAGISYTRDGAQ